MEILIGLILLIWLAAIVGTQYKGKKNYETVERQKIIASGLEESKLEHLLGYIGIIILVGFVVIVLWGIIRGSFDERVMLYLVAIYLCIYYALEYICHNRWCFTDEGLRGSRQLETIGFEKMINFTWYERTNKLILRVNYKGRGIVTRKSDYVVPVKKRQEVERLLKNKVIITRG